MVIADARIDGREELTNLLKAGGAIGVADATDPELILRAYQLWG